MNVRHNTAEHFFDLYWAKGGVGYHETENQHILALVGSDGVVCGFKVVNIDRLSEDEHGFAKAFIKARMESPTVNQPL